MSHVPFLRLFRRFLLPLLALLAAGSALAEEKLPLPRFASLQSNQVNMRQGPGETYPIIWTYQRAGLPVEIIEEFDIWRRIRDHDGVVGWVKSTLLVGKRNVIVRDSQRPLRASAEAGASTRTRRSRTRRPPASAAAHAGGFPHLPC
jgi:SH3-like domain-containing protein